MRYVSTRGKDERGVSSAYAIKTGLAKDKGLFMPDEIPSLSLNDIESLIPLSYPQRAAKILSLFLSAYYSISPKKLQSIYYPTLDFPQK